MMADDSHWWQHDSRRAICGRFVIRSQFSTEPTCPDCQRYLADHARALQDLASAPIDRSQLVKPQHFDPTAGYRPRRRRH
jgi:hypothetical protein